KVKDFREIRLKYLRFSWDKAFLQFVDIKFSAEYGDNVPNVYNEDENGRRLEWVSRTYEEGTNFADDVVLFSIGFRPLKAGQTKVRFAPYLNEDLNSSAQVKNTKGVIMDAIFQDAIVTVNQNFACGDTIKTIQNISLCDGDSHIINNQAYNQTGTYQISLKTTDGCDSIITLELTVDAPEDYICLPNDTITIPEGFTHLISDIDLLRKGNLLDSFVNVSSSCFSDRLPSVDIIFPIEDRIYGLGNTDYEYTFFNEQIKQSCVYSIDVQKGLPDRTLPGLLIDDINTKNGEDFCVDVTVKDFRKIAFAIFELEWDAEILEFLEVRENLSGEVTKLDVGLTQAGLVSCVLNHFEANGLTLSDETILFSLCFRGKRKGATRIVMSSKRINIVSHEVGTIENNQITTTEWLFKQGEVSVEEACLVGVFTSLTASICDGDDYIFGNQAYNQTGTYADTLTAANGCDSLSILNLTVLPSITTEITAEITEGENYIFNNQAYNQSGTYQFTFTAANGCDSIVNLQLTVLPKQLIQTVLQQTICENDNFEGYSQAGTYTDTFQVSSSIDSIRILELKVEPNFMEALSAQICQGDNFLFNNQAHNQTGNYETTFTTSNGCDSVVQLMLEVLPVPLAAADTFSALENEAITFNLVENDTIPSAVSWQTTTITPPHVGTLTDLGNGQFSYAPRVAYTGTTFFEYQICNEVCLPEGCTTTKVFLEIEGANETVAAKNPFPVPPTTTTETSKVQLSNDYLQETELLVFNIYGQLIETGKLLVDDSTQLWNLRQSGLPAGIYFYIKKSKGGNTILETGKIITIGR
ncbi:MAG: Ig-like domain-containing protein, partial [Bacteroidota bacterium]